ncbi:transposase [Weissella fermenti]|uniref:Transposase n=1 Tax=Weissella fermenti TaxID=2987699 RepID=A0ABT6D6I2_9LACO|nr:transposase [Weissella sp. BK2]MDF9300135.1 transposase [Weissella sp. BK2]
MSRSKYSPKEKLKMIESYQKSSLSMRAFALSNNVGLNALHNWLRLYANFGMEGLSESPDNQKYSKEFKRKVVQAYLSGEGTLRELTRRFKLRSDSQISDWVSKYNGNQELRSSGAGTRRVTMASRKTTFEERVEIATYAIEHDRNFTHSSEEFKVSYQQVRSWVLKVEAGGFEALRDGRGRKKTADELSEMDKLVLENKRLKAELKAQQMKLDLAKKLQEILSKGR